MVVVEKVVIQQDISNSQKEALQFTITQIKNTNT